ncbi:MAG: SDR family oxidoreductase [Bacillota bacterium]|nr:SDR family oxidoreductase [Bacillota bacterium]MDW7682768.1 SDR family oxidoreductase [Bacillota bacterium]
MGKKVFITGMTGNVGSEVAHALYKMGYPFSAGVRNIRQAREIFGSQYEYVEFDFLNPSTYAGALAGSDKLFLIRPPALADFRRQIRPFLDFAVQAGVKRIVFLSLMGVERNPIPPHYRIEKYIRSLQIPYTFLRPSFFMQNLHQAHCEDIKKRSNIYIPAGRAKISFIDTRDIGEIGAKVFWDPIHENQAYTLTGQDALNYEQVAEIFTSVLGRKIIYANPSPFAFRKAMIGRGVDKKYVNVMVALYLTTRMGMAKAVSADTADLLGRAPGTVRNYVQDYARYWEE